LKRGIAPRSTSQIGHAAGAFAFETADRSGTEVRYARHVPARRASRARAAATPSPASGSGSRAATGAWTFARVLVASLVAVFVLKLVVVLQLHDHPMTQPDVGLDTTAYVDLARRVIAGDWGLGPGLYFVSPLYIYVLAAILGATDSFLAVRIVQIGLGTAAAGAIALTAREWFGRRAAWIALALSAFTGLFTFYEALLIQAALDPFLTAAALFALAIGLARDDRRAQAAAGVLFGLGALNRPNMLLAAAGLVVVIAILRRWRPALLVAAGLALGLAPGAIRNVVVSGEWTFASSHGGLNLYIGNHANATGFYRQVPGISPTIQGQQSDARLVVSQALGRPVTDAEVSEYFVDRALAWMREEPARAAALFARKVYYTLHAQHIALPYSFPFYAYDARTALALYAVGPWLLMPLGLVGLVWTAPRERRIEYIAWASFVPLYTGAVALFFVSERYRLPLLVPCCVGAGAAIDRLLAIGARREWRALAVPAAVGAAFFVALNWPLPVSDGRWDEGLRMAQRLVIIGRDADAAQWAERLEATADRPGAGRRGAGRAGVGMQYLVRGQPARALPFLERAHRDDPENAAIEYALGQALTATGDHERGIPHLRRGVERAADVPMLGFDLAMALQRAGRRDEAIDALARVTPDDRNPEDWLRAGRLAMELQAPAAAEPFFRRAAALVPAQAGARQQYGLNLLVLGRFDEAARELAEAARLDPGDADTLAHLAYCELQRRRFAEARQHARAALGIDANHPVARQVDAALDRIGGGDAELTR
jgi:tetratricopeptide (TPR) repeat protein